MDNIKNSPIEPAESPDLQDRREVVRKLGRFAAYAAPFTVLAMTAKAEYASGAKPTPQSQKAQASHR